MLPRASQIPWWVLWRSPGNGQHLPTSSHFTIIRYGIYLFSYAVGSKIGFLSVSSCWRANLGKCEENFDDDGCVPLWFITGYVLECHRVLISISLRRIIGGNYISTKVGRCIKFQNVFLKVGNQNNDKKKFDHSLVGIYPLGNLFVLCLGYCK